MNSISNDNNYNLTTAPNTPISSRHGRKLSHVQFGKRPYNLHDDYASSTFILQFEEQKKETIPVIKEEEEESQQLTTKFKGFLKWINQMNNIGPFIKGEHWPIFTYLMVVFTMIIFSGELLLSKESSGEFFELEPFNYMLGPSMEIMIQSGARFPPCMRKVESMPSDQRYICLKTISHLNLTPLAAANTNKSELPITNQLVLFDSAIELTDKRLFNSTCSLSTICGMTDFHQRGIPDQTYRILSPLFIHTGLIHLMINMLVLFILGSRVERTINSLRFALLYVCSGVFGHALGANFSPPTTPFLGCSSSLFGLIGYLYVDILITWKELKSPIIIYLTKLIMCTGFTFLIGILPGVDTFSHMGGLFSGVLLSLFLLPVSWWSKLIKLTSIKIGLFYLLRIFSGVLFALLLGLLVHHFSISKLDQICPYCRYISCLPINGFCD